MKHLSINPDCHIQAIPVPGTEETAYVVDDFLSNPDEVVKFAREVAYLGPVGSDGTLYPGKRDAMPLPYRELLARFLSTQIENGQLSMPDATVDVYRSLLSLTTLRPDELQAAQRIPHVDSTDPGEYATVHFLCGPPHGGTGLFRYRPTQTVQVEPGQEALFYDILEQLERHPEAHSGYLSGDTPLFEQVLDFPARYNRLIIYKSNLLHSALLSDTIDWRDNLQQGRLSVASFFSINQSSDSQ